MGAFVAPSVAADSMPPVPPVPPPAAMLCSGMIGAPPPTEVTLEALLSRTMPSAMWTASATPGLAAPEVRGLARAGVKPEAVSSKGRTMRVEARKQWPQTYHTVCVETSSTGWPWKQFSHRCCWGGSSKGWKVRDVGTALPRVHRGAYLSAGTAYTGSTFAVKGALAVHAGGYGEGEAAPVLKLIGSGNGNLGKGGGRNTVQR